MKANEHFRKLQLSVFCSVEDIWPIPVAALSKASVCGLSPVGIVGSNPTVGMDVCLLSVLCCLSVRGLCDELITLPEESYRLWRVVEYDLET